MQLVVNKPKRFVSLETFQSMGQVGPLQGTNNQSISHQTGKPENQSSSNMPKGKSGYYFPGGYSKEFVSQIIPKLQVDISIAMSRSVNP